jgi:ABC-type nitrate/sulfonate/bicarbonate transport system substrate-binding protein
MQPGYACAPRRGRRVGCEVAARLGGVVLLAALACGPNAPAAGPAPAAPPSAAAVATTPTPPLERFRYGFPATSLSYYYLQAGEAAGLYQREGLEPELLHLPASTLLAALLAGEVDYTAGAAGGIRLAVRGQPVRLLSTVSLQNFSLIARPEFASGAALRGKSIGVGSRGASADRATQQAVRSLGLDPLNDVTIVVIGDQPVQLEALRAGRLEAIMSSPPQSVQAEREGFRVLANTADLEAIVIGGVATTLAKLESTRERTRRLLRAEWETVRYMKANPAETIALLAERFSMSAEDAAVAYAQTVPYYWDRLELNLAAVESTIAAEREAAEMTAAVPVDQVVDPAPLAEVRASTPGAPE